MEVDDGSRMVGILAVAAVAISPLWFLQLFSVNLGVADVLLLTVAMVYLFETRAWVLFPSRPIALGTLVFLLGGAISITVSPVPLISVLNFIQYVFIFVITIPLVLGVFQSRRRRWYAILLLWVVFNLITLIAFWTSLSVPADRINRISLWYGNQNNLHWIVACTAVANSCMMLDKKNTPWIRGVSSGFLVVSIYLVIFGLSLSSWLLVLAAGWFLVLIYILKYHEERKRLLLSGLVTTTVLGTAAAVTVMYLHWDFFYKTGNLDKRSFMYIEAIKEGTARFPFGGGLNSAPVVMDERMAEYPGVIARSVHNVFLSYYVEAGILAVIGITIILAYWIRGVLINSLQGVTEFHLFELIPMLIFTGYLLVLLFQNVPVHRFWWIMFALSWETVHSQYKPEFPDSHHSEGS